MTNVLHGSNLCEILTITHYYPLSPAGKPVQYDMHKANRQQKLMIKLQEICVMQ